LLLHRSTFLAFLIDMGLLSCLLAPFKACFGKSYDPNPDHFAYAKLDCDAGLSPEGERQLYTGCREQQHQTDRVRTHFAQIITTS
jgi:hypothetical protein